MHVSKCRRLQLFPSPLDTQVYSNTGGQSSTASYTGQNTKFTAHGKAIPGKIERRKELAQICTTHSNTFVSSG